MKHALAPLAFLVLAPLSFAPAGNTPSFGVAKGTKLTKHFETTIALEKQAVSITIAGRELPPEITEQIEMSFSFKDLLEVEDEYLEIDGARAKKLARTFHKATESSNQHMVMMGGAPQDKESELESPLVDHTVVFTWNAKDEKYERAFQGGKGEDKWLEKLEQDMDFLCLLPEGELAVDRTWTLEAKQFDDLTLPGGKLSFEKKKTESLDLEENLAGKIEAKYTGTREVEGHKYGVIALTAKLDTHQETEEEDGPPMKMQLAFELEGEYLWDLESQHLHSFELRGPAKMEMNGEQEVEARGQKMAMKLHFELAGEMKLEGKFGG